LGFFVGVVYQVEIISMAAHRNLLRLYGFCTTPNERLLVYPFMSNGSVSSQLQLKSMFLFPATCLFFQRLDFAAKQVFGRIG
jgi:hypothetical protein